MSRTLVVVPRLSKEMAELVREANGHLKALETAEKKIDQRKLSAALAVGKIKEAYDAGERCDTMKWSDFCETHLHKSERYVRELISIAKSADPAQALEQTKEATALRVAAHRERRKDEATGVTSGCNTAPPPPTPADYWLANTKILLKDGSSPDELHTMVDRMAAERPKVLCTVVNGVIPFSTDDVEQPLETVGAVYARWQADTEFLFNQGHHTCELCGTVERIGVRLAIEAREKITAEESLRKGVSLSDTNAQQDDEGEPVPFLATKLVPPVDVVAVTASNL